MQRLRAGPCAVTFPRAGWTRAELRWWGLYSCVVEVVSAKCCWSGWQTDSPMIAPRRLGWGAARSMGTGDYMCVTLRGGAPWGFTLREGEGDTYRPFIVSQVSICVSVLMFYVHFIHMKVLIWDEKGLMQIFLMDGHVVILVSHCKDDTIIHLIKILWTPHTGLQVTVLIEFCLLLKKIIFKKLSSVWRDFAFLRVLAVFWCEIPQDPYMVKAKKERECEAEGSVICYHSQKDFSEKSEHYSGEEWPTWRVSGMCVMQEEAPQKVRLN